MKRRNPNEKFDWILFQIYEDFEKKERTTLGALLASNQLVRIYYIIELINHGLVLGLYGYGFLGLTVSLFTAIAKAQS